LCQVTLPCEEFGLCRFFRANIRIQLVTGQAWSNTAPTRSQVPGELLETLAHKMITEYKKGEDKVSAAQPPSTFITPRENFHGGQKVITNKTLNYKT